MKKESRSRWSVEGSGGEHLETGKDNEWLKAEQNGLKQELRIACLSKCKDTTVLRCFAYFSIVYHFTTILPIKRCGRLSTETYFQYCNRSQSENVIHTEESCFKANFA